MNSPLIQLLVLAGIAVFLILRLKNVLGSREGFERPPAPQPREDRVKRPEFEVIDGGPDLDITDHVEELSLIHISEPTRLRRISYAVFCLKKKTKNK